MDVTLRSITSLLNLIKSNASKFIKGDRQTDRMMIS
jgi:hypothetical protein